MKKDNILVEKSFEIAAKIVGVYNRLREESKEHSLSEQVVGCGASIGANEEEAIGRLSEKDFEAKLDIAYKDSRETIYYYRRLYDAGTITSEQFENMTSELEETCRMIDNMRVSMKREKSNQL